MEKKYKRLARVTLQLASCALLASQPVSGFLQDQQWGRSITRTTVRLQFSGVDALEEQSMLDDSTTGSLLVLTGEQGNSKYSTFPPWLRRSEQSTPEVVESEIDAVIIALAEHEFSEGDISDIITAIYLTAAGDVRLLNGSAEFCKLILRLEEPGERYNLLVTKDVILASILHYSECVAALQDGIYQKVQKAIGMERTGPQQDKQRFLPGSSDDSKAEMEETNLGDEEIFPQSSVSMRKKLSNPDKIGIEIFSLEALRLAEEASRIKRAEILTDIVLTNSRALTKAEYGDINNMLLSVTQDWRALAIRCVSSLYRLEGVLWDRPLGTGEYLRRDTATTLNARYSIRVYATLSQRMGLHRLQSQLEGSAFRILYPRQFSAVSTLFQQKGEAMRAVSSFLSSEITALINDDQSLVEQLKDCDIQARVKSPFSFWKKLVKKRRGANGGMGLLSPASAISVADVLDGVALRVIIKAHSSPTDVEKMIDAHERMLCYYVHYLIRSQWPATDKDRIKDYIKRPKSNGYQSLHHTSSITYNDQVIPFEVQVRSEKMHRFAEFGVAAHWDYKADNKKLLLPSSRAPSVSSKAGPVSKSRKARKGNASDSSRMTKFSDMDSAYINALHDAREHLVRSNVYVFLSGSISDLEGGHLLSLRAGSQVVDILAELGRKFDVRTDKNNFQVWRNGQLALPDEVVGNGDVILFQNLSGDIQKKGSKKIVAAS
jgi:ppGpp synthetase/RelA/SpoT-type nucleotidyltranferase